MKDQGLIGLASDIMKAGIAHRKLYGHMSSVHGFSIFDIKYYEWKDDIPRHGVANLSEEEEK
eukprot:1561857-Ditylum_brightwellii.AAC.1